MKTHLGLILGLGLVAGPLMADGHATGDAEAGAAVFNNCKACHSITDADGENIVRGGQNGPNLYGVFNRQAGTLDGFRYGDAIVEAGEAGLLWNEEDFLAYTTDPQDFLRTYLDNRRARSNMAFKLRDEEDRANVWAYLVSVGPEVDLEAMDEDAEAASN